LANLIVVTWNFVVDRSK